MAKKAAVRYVWGGRVSGKAQAVGEELERLQKKHGRSLSAPIVLDAARDVDSPLHPCFEWSDTDAAEKYRLWQAREVIRSIRIVKQDGPDSTPMRVFINVADAQGEQSYVPVSRVLSDPEMFERARQAFIAESDRFAEKYREFEALKKLVDNMREQAVKLSA